MGHCSFFGPSPNRATELSGGGPIWDSINLAHKVCSILGNPRGSAPPNLRASQAFNGGFSMSIADLSSGFISSKFSQKSNDHLQWAPIPCTSSKAAPGMTLAAASFDSQSGFSWEPPRPAQVAAISDCFVAHAGWPQVQHRWADLDWHHQGNLRTYVSSDSYRHWSTSTWPLHSWSSTESRGWWAVVTASPCPWLARLNPSHWPANSSQSSTTKGGCTQPTERVHIEYPAWVIGEAVPLDPTGHLLY